MRSSRMGLIAACLVVTAASGFALEWTRGNATEWVRLTDDGRSVAGALSPDGRSIAIIGLRKDFTADGHPFFHRELHLGDGSASRRLAELPPSKPITYVPELRHTCAHASVEWLPSGRFMLCCTDYRDRTLVRLDDGATTAVGSEGTWFVLNSEWQLPQLDASHLAATLHVNPWVDDPLGKLLHEGDLPSCVPRESEKWWYQDFRRTPAAYPLALYCGADKSFDGCCCTAYLNQRYLGVVDLRTGRMKRLTWGSDHTVSQCRWSPDGGRIFYLRRPYGTVEEGWRGLVGSDLHRINRDGSDDRHLCAGVSSFSMLADGRLLLCIGEHGWRASETWWHDWEQQLAVLDCNTLKVRRLTAGPFHHGFLDRDDDRFLIRETPVGAGANQGDLYLIRPL